MKKHCIKLLFVEKVSILCNAFYENHVFKTKPIVIYSVYAVFIDFHSFFFEIPETFLLASQPGPPKKTTLSHPDSQTAIARKTTTRSQVSSRGRHDLVAALGHVTTSLKS